MAYKVEYSVYERPDKVTIYCDAVSDIATLPTDFQPGSAAFVIATGTVYMLNNSGVWTEI